VQVIEYTDPDQAVCVVTNYGLMTSELVTGPVEAEVFDVHLQSNDKIKITDLTTTPHAAIYSISFKIARADTLVTDLGEVQLSRLFSIPGMLAAKLTPQATGLTPADAIVITPRRRVYQLVSKTVTPPAAADGGASVPVTGWDIEDLRTQINANDPWVEMPARPGPAAALPADGSPALVIDESGLWADKQDTLRDGDVLVAFAEKRVAGGDGLPDTPDRECTGPFRSLVHVNYGEATNGALKEINTVYEWNGKNSAEGTWKSY
jgi:hypothetical protein